MIDNQPVPKRTNEEWLEEVRAAHKARAAFYYQLFCELKDEFSEDKALEILGRTCKKLGLKKAQAYRPKIDELTAKGFCHYFCNHGSVNNKIFEMKTETAVEEETGIACLCRCPLVEGWKELGVSAGDIEKLCSAAMEVDYGTVEGLGLKGEFSSLISRGGDCCRLVVKDQ